MSLPFELLDYFTAEDLARGAARATTSRVVFFVELALDLGILLALAFGRPGRWLADACGRLAGKRRTALLDRVLGSEWAAGALFLAAAMLLRELLLYPLGFYRDFVVAHSFDVSNESLGSFVRRGGRDALMASAGFAALGATVGAVRARWPRGWWAAIGLATAVPLFASALIDPYWQHLDFNVQPLSDGPLRERLERLTEAHDARVGEIVTIDSSRYGKAVNAFLVGAGPTRRLVLTDTLVEMGDEAVAGAVAHEIGHRRDERLPGRLVMAWLALFGLLGLVELSLRFARRRGVPSDSRAIPFTLMLLSVLSLALAPLRNALGREEEREADRLELSIRRDHDAYIAEQVRKVRARAGEPQPPPFFYWLFADHPSAAERIGLALWYKQQVTGDDQ